jgi:hypothetical protein
MLSSRWCTTQSSCLQVGRGRAAHCARRRGQEGAARVAAAGGACSVATHKRAHQPYSAKHTAATRRLGLLPPPCPLATCTQRRTCQQHQTSLPGVTPTHVCTLQEVQELFRGFPRAVEQMIANTPEKAILECPIYIRRWAAVGRWQGPICCGLLHRSDVYAVASSRALPRLASVNDPVRPPLFICRQAPTQAPFPPMMHACLQRQGPAPGHGQGPRRHPRQQRPPAAPHGAGREPGAGGRGGAGRGRHAVRPVQGGAEALRAAAPAQVEARDAGGRAGGRAACLRWAAGGRVRGRRLLSVEGGWGNTYSSQQPRDQRPMLNTYSGFVVVRWLPGKLGAPPWPRTARLKQPVLTRWLGEVEACPARCRRQQIMRVWLPRLFRPSSRKD